MDPFGRRPAVVAMCLLTVLAVGTPAGAVEYRMKFANIFDIVEQGPTPTTFEAVITWGNSNAQAPGGGGPVLGTN